MDRCSQKEILNHADLQLQEGNKTEAYIALKEASRIDKLGGAYSDLLNEIFSEVKDEQAVIDYRKKIGEITDSATLPLSRILVINNIFPPQQLGGFGRQVHEFAIELERRGHTTQVLTCDIPSLDRPEDTALSYPKEKIYRTLETYGDWEKMPPSMIDDMDEAVKIAYGNLNTVIETLDSFKPEFCMIGNIDLIGYAWIEKILERRIPIINLLGNDTTHYPSNVTPDTPLYRFGPCSNWVGEQMGKGDFIRHPYFTIYPGGNLEKLYRHYMPSDYNKPRMVYAGLIMDIKGPRVLVDALIKLHHDGIDFTCDIAGDTNVQEGFMEELLSKVNTHGLEEKVRFHGHLDTKDLWGLYGKSNTLIFPSSCNEAFGKSIIEAMSSGLAVVCSGTGGQKEIISHDINGIIFEPMNREDLAEKLKSLFSNPLHWKNIAKAGKEHAFEFTTSKSITVLEKSFQKIKDECSKVDPEELTQLKPSKLRKEIQTTCMKAIALLQEDQDLEAMNLLNSIQKAGNVFPECQLTLAKFMLKHNDIDQAKTAFSHCAIMRPCMWESHAGLGAIHLKKNEYEKAIITLDRAIKLKPSEPTIYELQAYAYEAIGKNKEAKTARQKARSLNTE